MSLSVTGVWEVGVWETTPWAAGVWREGAYDAPLDVVRASVFINQNISTDVVIARTANASVRVTDMISTEVDG